MILLRSSYACRAILALAILPWAACSTVAWQDIPDDVPAKWRHLTLHRAEAAYVLASSASEAAEAPSLSCSPLVY